MPSTPFAYPQVVSRTFASFRVAKFSVSAGHGDFCDGFDSRQLHREGAGQSDKLWQFSFHQYLKNGRVIQVNPSLAAVP
jgi:hypothetical protein